MPFEKSGFVYILANWTGSVLYTGVTNDLKRRLFEPKNRTASEFTSKYNVNRLVYYENCEDIEVAIFREKQIKAGSRIKKVHMISRFNPKWDDLYDRV